jgi:hypothetical protein
LTSQSRSILALAAVAARQVNRLQQLKSGRCEYEKTDN